jgi:cytochrome c
MSHNWLRGPGPLRSAAAILIVTALGCLYAGCSSVEGDPALYKKYCAACHGPEGQGLRSLYPALEGSAYLNGKIEQLPCLIRKGAGNSVRMPGFPQLTSGEMSDLIVYLDSRWGTNHITISEQTVAAWLNSCP